MKMIGIDFDNTIVTYDEVFYKYAFKLGLISGEVKKNKKAIRDAIRALPEGNTRWTELQGIVYGTHMQEAQPMPGVESFLEACKKSSIRIYIISHKTAYSVMGPRVNLQEAAKQWLQSRDFLSKFGLGESHVIFEETQAGKLSRIAQMSCQYFIDDLTEVLGHPDFPKGVRKMLYGQQEGEDSRTDIIHFKDWDEIKEYFFSSKANNTHVDVADLLDGLFRSELEEKVLNITKLPGGINSETFKVQTDKNNVYVAKKYKHRPEDPRDRMSTEYSGLFFLWTNGIRNIPEPLFASLASQIAVYRFIDGVKLIPGNITKSDIDEAADFVGRFHALVGSQSASMQPAASEACFSIQAHIDCVDRRVTQLRKDVPKSVLAFLEDEFLPYFDETKRRAIQKSREFTLDIKGELHHLEKTLSASDFGFHNALKTKNGKIYFLDFEYFGWDDPAKLIADFYLQPAVPVPLEYREHFYKKVRGNFKEGVNLEKRLQIIYPLLGLKWCLIMLNPFLRPDSFSEELLSDCLNKTKAKFKGIKSEIAKNTFPLEIF